MAEPLPPVDESVKIPDSVKAQAAAAEAFYNNPPAEQTPEPPAAEAAPAQTPEPEAPAPTPAPEPAPENSALAELQAKLTKLEKDHNALLGRWRQRNAHPQMQPEPPARTFAEPPKPQPRHLITEEERKAYGDEALSVMERKAQEVVIPVVEALTNQNRHLHQEIQRVKQNDVYTALDVELPNWREINAKDEWKDWLRLPDLYSGLVRQDLLNQAHAAGDAGRVLAFFRGYLAENPEHMGQQTSTTTPVPPATPVRKAAIDLKSLAAPGRASSSPPPATAPAPTITTNDITQFYWDVTHGRYDGRAEAKAKRDAEIHAAVKEGRVVRTKK